MTDRELTTLLDDLIALDRENEWVEFKLNNKERKRIGIYISALSNSACLHGQDFGYLVYGVTDDPHIVEGTNFRFKGEKEGNQPLELWLNQRLQPKIDYRVYEFQYNGLNIVLFKIPATYNRPVKFDHFAHIRVDSATPYLDDYPDRERKIWNAIESQDYSIPPPFQLSKIFGRESDLEQIKMHLLTIDDSTPTSPFTIVYGLPGVGKTALAAHLAKEDDLKLAFPNGFLWASLGKTPNLLEILTKWEYGLGFTRQELSCQPKEVTSNLAKLLKDKKMLLVIDDVWNPEDVAYFRFGGKKCAMLVTTRLYDVAHSLASKSNDVYKLECLTLESSLALLKNMAPTVVEQSPQECLELVKRLGCLPLALKVSGSWLNEEAYMGSVGLTISAILEQLHDLLKRPVPIELSDLANETTPIVAVLLKKSIDRLNPETLKYFAFLGDNAVAEPATFSLEALSTLWEVTDPTPIVRKLIQRNLIEPADKRFQIHPIQAMLAKTVFETNQVISDEERYKKQLLWAAYYVVFLSSIAQRYMQNSKVVTLTMLAELDAEWSNIQESRNWSVRHMSTDSIAAAVCSEYANSGSPFLRFRQNLNQQVLWLQDALHATQYLNDREKEAIHWGNMGIAYKNMGELRDALKCYEKQQVIYDELGNNEQKAITLSNIGVAYKSLGKCKDAVEVYQQALEIFQRLGDTKSEATILLNMGIAYYRQNQIRIAISFYNQALVIAREIDDKHSEAKILMNLGNAYDSSNRSLLALECHKAALSIVRQFGDIRGEALVLTNMGDVYYSLSDYAQCIQLKGEALSLFIDSGDLFNQGVSLWGISKALKETGEIEEAVIKAQSAVDIFKQINNEMMFETVQHYLRDLSSIIT